MAEDEVGLQKSMAQLQNSSLTNSMCLLMQVVNLGGKLFAIVPAEESQMMSYP